MKYSCLKPLGLALTLAVGSSVFAQERSITVSAPGGTFEQWLRKDVFPAFTSKTGVKVNYVVASATDLIAKLQAQKQSQLSQFQHDEQMEDAKQLGKAGAEVLRQTTEHALTNMEVEGEPGNTGFGDTAAL